MSFSLTSKDIPMPHRVPLRILITAFVPAVAALAFAVPALAAPDESTYLSDLRDNGFTGSDQVLLDLGYRACADWDHGVSRNTIVEDIYQNSGTSVAHTEARIV